MTGYPGFLGNIKSIVDALDAALATASVHTIGEKAGLSSFLFHAIKEVDKTVPTLYPQEGLTLELFDQLICTMLELDYTFVGSEELLNGSLYAGNKYGLLTFDDGYFNNTWCLEVLKKYKVPAVFFITTNWIQANEKMWADIIFYERWKQGVSVAKTHREIRTLIPWKISKIKDYITCKFGIESFTPQGDEDRPMTEAELKNIATNALVTIGNHTHNHECLTNLSTEDVCKEIAECDARLKNITGRGSELFSYPYGRYSEQVVREVQKMGFKLGLTIKNKKNHLPVPEDSMLMLNRFNPAVLKHAFNYDQLRTPFYLKSTLIDMAQPLIKATFK